MKEQDNNFYYGQIKQEENETHQFDECEQEITDDFNYSDGDVFCSEEKSENNQEVHKLTTAIQEEKIRKRKELARERAKRYRERKRIKALQTVDDSIHDSEIPIINNVIIMDHNLKEEKYKSEYSAEETENVDQQIQDEKIRKRKELARERARRYREKKRINALKVHLIHDSKIPGPSHDKKLIQGEKINKQKELAREHKRRFRENKCINSLENNNLICDLEMNPS